MWNCLNRGKFQLSIFVGKQYLIRAARIDLIGNFVWFSGFKNQDFCLWFWPALCPITRYRNIGPRICLFSRVLPQPLQRPHASYICCWHGSSAELPARAFGQTLEPLATHPRTTRSVLRPRFYRIARHSGIYHEVVPDSGHRSRRPRLWVA